MKAITILIISLFSTSILADTSVRGYFRKDGTYVAPHARSSPNTTRMDNYGSASSNQSFQPSPLMRDSDGDGLFNQYDMDDDNDGTFDDSDNN